jgi:hypothetical protein
MALRAKFETSAKERYMLPRLVLSLRETADAISASIAVEEERIQLRDEDNPCYSTPAKSLSNRLANLKKTIAILEDQSA